MFTTALKEVFYFEIKYRQKRPETYLFFGFLFLTSIFGVDFIFQGVELGQVKLNAPLVIGKTMGAITGIYMILASLIMGMPMIRDDQHKITSLFYTQPIHKGDLLLGRFLGALVVLLVIFTGVPLGMMVGESLPWRIDSEMKSFLFSPYISGYISIMAPALFFGACLFFVSGSLSKKLMVVYTQGIILFVVFLITKAIPNEHMQAILDPFSLTTITQLSKDWTLIEKNTKLLPLDGVLLLNKLFWIILGLCILWVGFNKFSFTIPNSKKRNNREPKEFNNRDMNSYDALPKVVPLEDWYSSFIQWMRMSIFYGKSLLKETSFWSIVVCGAIIIFVNSISLGTVYGVDSYPTTYFIVEELQELSMYFFIIILLFYSGELFWKERGMQMDVITDSTPISTFIILCSKITGLISVFVVLMISLICSGLLFQLGNGYYHFDLNVYFTGFFIEILPFLVIHTFASFFLHSIVNNKFVGILASLAFMILIIALGALGYNNVILLYGGGGLPEYSEMNGYGHFLPAYIWAKIYWVLVGIILLFFASKITSRGEAHNLFSRFKRILSSNSVRMKRLLLSVSFLILSIGSFLYYQTHILNEVWTEKKENEYRARYETELKEFEFISQPKIVESNILIEIYPNQRSYELQGEYFLKNLDSASIQEIHVQKLIDSNTSLDSIQFSQIVEVDDRFQDLEYMIYKLKSPLIPGDSIRMEYKQAMNPKGFSDDQSIGTVIGNGSFIRCNEFPTFGYNKKYELRDEEVRQSFNLLPRQNKADMRDSNELKLARSGSDSEGVKTKIIIGTAQDQIGVTSGRLIKQWEKSNRSYFEYHSKEEIINFYSMLSGKYNLYTDTWQVEKEGNSQSVDLEIYYNPRHPYNLDRMMDGMKSSLSYYSEHFSPYQYEQLRIVEFPRYEQFAQSFPNTIPFSESIGFMLEINDSTDVDMTFFVTAHEVAHQWWGMQLETANVKGRNFVLETLAQYSAMMVFKDRYKEEKYSRFITMQNELYEEGKNKSKNTETSLLQVEDEEYIYYNKGVVIMEDLRLLIGEATINNALKAFLADWNSKNGIKKLKISRFSTAEDLLEYILAYTPKEQKEHVKNLISDV